MAYRTINADLQSHLSSLVSFLIEEVMGSGGDGDGLWYSRFYNVKDLHEIFKPLIPPFWRTEWSDDNTVSYGDGEEWLMVTNNKELYENAPSWQQILIKY